MINAFSQTAYYLETFFEGKSISSGTCFFVKRKERLYLITNWHVVTNRNPNDGSYLQYAVDPDEIQLVIFKNQDEIHWDSVRIKLFENGKRNWLEHPVYKEKVDVIAMEVVVSPAWRVFDFEQFIEPFNEKTTIHIAYDVFVIGFPFGLMGGGALPIWKRASIASEPVVDIDGLPKMYLDTATRPGMSGSPVLYMAKRSILMGDGAPGSARKLSAHFMKFVGVYSGRIGAEDELKAQLGIAWKAEVIDEIISHGVKEDENS